jgi:hypothetical protein
MSRSIASFFKPAVADVKTTPTSTSTSSAPEASSIPVHLKPFYDSLSPAETLAHTIAKKELGTSYDVERTNQYKKWLEHQKK